MPLHQKAWISAFRAHGAGFDFSWDLFMSRARHVAREEVEELNLQFALSMDRCSFRRRSAQTTKR